MATIEGGPGSWALTGALARVETPAGLFELLRPRVADQGAPGSRSPLTMNTVLVGAGPSTDCV